MDTNESVWDATSNQINNGFTKAQLDYSTKGLEYALKNSSWLLNSESEAYGEYIREFFISTSALFDIIKRIDRIRETSNNLKKLIKKELENRYI